jgi:hypothetical protein
MPNGACWSPPVWQRLVVLLVWWRRHRADTTHRRRSMQLLHDLDSPAERVGRFYSPDWSRYRNHVLTP